MSPVRDVTYPVRQGGEAAPFRELWPHLVRKRAMRGLFH